MSRGRKLKSKIYEIEIESLSQGEVFLIVTTKLYLLEVRFLEKKLLHLALSLEQSMKRPMLSK